MSPINPLSVEESDDVTDTFTRSCGWGCTIHVLGGREVRHACAGNDVLHRLLSVLGVDFTDWQLDCLAVALEPRVRELAAGAFTQGVREGRSGVQYVEGYEAELGVEAKPSRTAAELERILEARTTENRHLRAEVSRLKREDWHMRWVFEHAGRERAEAEARRLSERGLALLRTLDSANDAAALAGDRADRAEAELRDVVDGELFPQVSSRDDRAVLGDVALERHRQDLKWGEQNHPDGTGPGMFFAGIPVEQYVEAVKEDLAIAAERGKATWAMILLEEVAEAFAESDPAKLRAELLQVSAVATAWVQAIDRRRERVRAAALARRRERAAHVQQVSRIFDVPVSMLVGPADADPVSGDGFAEVTGRALYVDQAPPTGEYECCASGRCEVCS